MTRTLGWTLIDPLMQDYNGPEYDREEYASSPDYMLNCEGGSVQSYLGQYHEEVIRAKALKYLDEAVARGPPFFLYISTVAPHDAKGFGAFPQVPPAYRNLFPGAKAPRTGNWGIPSPSNIGFSSSRRNDFNETDIDGRFRARVQALRAVDDTLDAILSRLACHGQENNTVVVFTSDNGFKLGNHNMAQEKFTFYEEDVRVPLLMAGPGIPRGVFVPEVAAAMTDLSATVAAIAGWRCAAVRQRYYHPENERADKRLAPASLWKWVADK
ncbi:N-acetylglucosamine-6-sulfatase [Tetrabaena socialis]|uniref:N-acetylglucosamine-6-sulfatase n=1 Tax=Tetrabaena socialis TaxID=47790 RepID=A0A2J8AAX3_9CHLO|nr:N-acetylglucosamine-6-sulfatase [Tetrabaena socialis]|eukprot:PNH09657.1 N-acetylglucosamine-6-sulfatase [Tetrabaena socialis]